MPESSQLELLNRRIAATADQIARQRELIERCRKQGQPTRQAEAALETLTRLFRRLLKERQTLQKEQD